MGSVEKAARQFFAGQKADARIPKGHPQREDLERKQQQYEQDFNATILNLFDRVLFPRQRPGKPADLASKPLEMTRDHSKPFNGEEQIEKTLTSNPLKLYLDPEREFDAIRDKAQDLLWPENQDEARWSDVGDRMAEQAGMPWLPPKGLDRLKAIACNRGLWEDLGNGYVTKRPKKKKTSVQVVPETDPDDQGAVRLRVEPQNAGPAPRIHFAQDGPVSESSPTLTDQTLTTAALRVHFLVVDPSGQYETGDPVTWTNKLVIRNRLIEEGDQRKVELFVAPRGTIRYSLNGIEAREGPEYTGPLPIPDGDVLVRAFAEAEGLEAKKDFPFRAKGKKRVIIVEDKPAWLTPSNGKKLDSRTKTFTGLSKAKETGASFESVTVTVGQGSQAVMVAVGEFKANAEYIESILKVVLEKFEPTTPVTMRFGKAHFTCGHDLKGFAEALGLELQLGEVEQ